MINETDNGKGAWNLALGIGGGVAIGVCAVAAVAAAPVEIAATIAAVGITKYAINKSNKKEDLVTEDNA